MKYDEELARQINNPSGYLWFKDSSPYSYLDGIAEDAFNKSTYEGYITALIIWHQLVEEILKLLVHFSNLVIKASIYPKKINQLSIENLTLGKLIGVHKKISLDFNKKSIIIKRADKLNKIRNELAHRIIQTPSEADIVEKIKVCKSIFDDIFKNWQISMKWFFSTIKSLQKRPDIKKIINRYVPK